MVPNSAMSTPQRRVDGICEVFRSHAAGLVRSARMSASVLDGIPVSTTTSENETVRAVGSVLRRMSNRTPPSRERRSTQSAHRRKEAQMNHKHLLAAGRQPLLERREAP